MKNKKIKKQRLVKYNYDVDNSICHTFALKFSSTGSKDFNVSIVKDGKEEILDVSSREVYYKGKNRDKIILSQPISGNNILHTEKFEILKYDLIVVIDTNYKVFHNKKYASTCWLVCEKHPLYNDNYRVIVYELNWIAKAEEEQLENIMYANIISKTEEFRKENNIEGQIAVVFDSDLDKINHYNERTMPIYDDFLLPESFKIFYASSERGTTEYLENRLMQMCDKEAKESLDKYLSQISNG